MLRINPGVRGLTLVSEYRTRGTLAKVAACGRNPRMFSGSQPGAL